MTGHRCTWTIKLAFLRLLVPVRTASSTQPMPRSRGGAGGDPTASLKHALMWVCRLSPLKMAAKQHWGLHRFWLIGRIHVVMPTARNSQQVTAAPSITELPRLLNRSYGPLVLDPTGHFGADGVDASLSGSLGARQQGDLDLPDPAQLAASPPRASPAPSG